MLLITSLYSNEAEAWEPCLPFCDARCSGRAALAMGTSVSGNISKLSAKCSQLLTALGETNTSIINMSTSIAETHIRNKSQVLSGLDATVSKYTLTNDLKGETLASFSDHLSSTFNLNSKNFLKTLNIIYNETRFGPRAAVDFSPFKTQEDAELASVMLAMQDTHILDNAMIAKEGSIIARGSNIGLLELLNKYGVQASDVYSQRTEARVKGMLIDSKTNEELFLLQQIYREKVLTFTTPLNTDQTEYVLQLGNINFATSNIDVTMNNVLHGASMQGLLSSTNIFHTQQSNKHGLLLKSNRQAQEKNSMLYQLLINAQSRNAELAIKLAKAHAIQ